MMRSPVHCESRPPSAPTFDDVMEHCPIAPRQNSVHAGMLRAAYSNPGR